MARALRIAPVLAILLLVFQPVMAAVPGATSAEGAGARAAPGGAVILFDEAHFPVYTVNPANPSGYGNGNDPEGAYADFAGVLSKAGFTVRTLDFGGSLNAATLSGVSALVIVCSQGIDPNYYHPPAPYTNGEVSAVVEFVRNGGGLFLIGDHTTFPPAIFPIADQFGIQFGQKLLRDPDDHVENTTSGLPPEGDVFIVFGRDNFKDHPLMANLTRIELYRTDIFTSLPPEAQPLIISDADTYYIDSSNNSVSAPRSIVAAAIPSNGVAGGGRIMVVADTNTFETDENRDSGDTDMDLFDSDNAQYGTRILEWLMFFRVGLGSAEKDSLGQQSIVHDCAAGSSTTFYIQVNNTGNVADSFDIDVDGPAAGWGLALSLDEVTLKMADARILTLVVSVPAGTQPGTSARFQLGAVSQGDPSISASMNCTVRVPIVHNITLTCADNRKSVQAGQTAAYDLILTNRGNVRENIGLLAPGPTGWECALDTLSAVMDAATNRTIRLNVTPPAGSLGGAEAMVVATATVTGSPGQEAGAQTYTRVIQRFGIRLSCPAPLQAVDPGSLVSFPILLSNVGNGDDESSLSLADPSRWGVYLEPSEVAIPFNSTVQVALVARAPEQAPAGEVSNFEVRAMSLREPLARANLSLAAVVNRMGKFRIQMEPDELAADPGMVAQFNVTVENIGNAQETVILETVGPAWLSRTDASVGPGGRAVLRLSYPVAADAPAGAQYFVEVTGTSSVNSTVWSMAGAVVVVNQIHRIKAVLSPDRLVIGPGEQGNCSISIQNEGNGPEAVSARLENAPAGWSQNIGDAVLAIEAGAMGQQRIGLGIPGGTPAGMHGLAVNISYAAGSFQLLSLTVEVPRLFGFSCSITPAGLSVLAGKEAVFILRLDNLGNSPEKIRLAGAGARAAWIHPAEDAVLVNLSAGREMELRVRPGPEAMPGKYILVLSAAGEGNDACNVSFNLTVKEAATATSDIPCLLGAVMVLAASAAAYLARRRLFRAAGATDDPKPSPKED